MSANLTTSRPGREGSAAADKPHVERARAVVQGDSEEKRIPLQAPPRYHRGLQELKNMISETTPVKHLLLEAIDDLFEKYSRGEGRFEVEDTAELKRRLQALK
ncbi:hypothetical protein 3S15_12 [uncultured Caudovirales phage]|uniref:Uncharacterized protein n=1 Tax=uncultured Caudovirales phage TaxID=2100421 RepID=A0A2H4JEY1_9CAUD|nr:hypothetical protein 3S15_12 [uncultured Caudovirales phage]